MTTPSCRLALAAALVLLTGCKPAPEPPEAVEIPAPAPVASKAAPAFAGSKACADCHAAEAAAHASSPHARDLQAGAGENPEAGGPLDDESLSITHRIGSRRRIVWLAANDGSLQVLPSAWSKTRGEWIDHRVDEGGPAAGAQDWTLPSSSWAERCAGCHPNAQAAAGREVALNPDEARGLDPGIGCEHCHGPGAAHSELAAGSPEDLDGIRSSILRSGAEPWGGCAACHASGDTLPLRAGEAWRAGDELAAHRFVDTALDATRPDTRFLSDGRPGTAHAFSVQSLAQSRCFREGELNCLSCHDPHAGGLMDADPDAACRSCHAGASADDHSGHPRPTAPVPTSLEEPRGPEPTRAPGCVDCHAPALLTFGSVDRVRDHAFAVPEPELARDFDMPDACIACHADRDPDELIAWLKGRFPERTTPRHARASAFRRSLGLSMIGESALAVDTVEPLLDLLADDSEDPWLRSSAASALGVLGAEARSASPELSETASSDSLELAHAAASALGKIGTDDLPALIAVARDHADWRVRVAAAASLDALGDSAGAGELEVIASDERLPTAAHAQARLQLGLAFLRRGLFERCVYQLEESIALDPRSVPAWLNLGVARAGLEDEEAARLAWLTVEDLEPGNLAARRNLALLDQRRSAPAP